MEAEDEGVQLNISHYSIWLPSSTHYCQTRGGKNTRDHKEQSNEKMIMLMWECCSHRGRLGGEEDEIRQEKKDKESN